jgi:hypothetical protein
VRAAGLAGRAAAREYEKQTAARPRPVEAAPPPPLATRGLLGRAVFVGFLLALLAAALVALRVDSLIGSHGPRLVFRVALVALLLGEALLLTSNWRGASERLAQRVLIRVWGPRSAVTRREKTFARLLRDSCTLVGIAFLAAALFELLSATIGSA